jgi:hypothetical protein
MEVRLDQASVRRFHRRKIVLLLAFALFFASIPVVHVVSALFSGAAGDRTGQAMILVGFLTVLSSPLWSSRDLIYYRCPQCRRRLSRVSPQGVAEASYHYACEDCGVIWDLGWAWGSGGEGGG